MVGSRARGIIADGFGLKLPFYFMTLVMLISGLLVLLFAKETFSKRSGEKPMPSPVD